MSKKKSLTSEERVAAVQEYLDGKGGYKAIARKYNIGATTMKRMVCRAKTEGIESVAKASPYRHYTNEIKEAAVEDYLNGKGSLSAWKSLFRIFSAVICGVDGIYVFFLTRVTDFR